MWPCFGIVCGLVELTGGAGVCWAHPQTNWWGVAGRQCPTELSSFTRPNTPPYTPRLGFVGQQVLVLFAKACEMFILELTIRYARNFSVLCGAFIHGHVSSEPPSWSLVISAATPNSNPNPQRNHPTPQNKMKTKVVVLLGAEQAADAPEGGHPGRHRAHRHFGLPRQHCLEGRVC